MKTKSIKINGIFNVIRQSCTIIFPLLIFPYVSRKLGPDNYGTYSFANSIITYFVLSAMMGVNLYAIREGARIRNDKEQILKFTSEVTTINFLSTVLSWIVLIILAIFGTFTLDTKKALLVLSIIVPSTFLGRDWINNIYEDYIYITIRYVIVQVIGLVAIYCLIHQQSDWFKYTIIYTLTTSMGYYINLVYCQRYCRFRLTLKPNFKKHIIPILILFSGQLAATLYIQSDITMIGIFSSSEQVGIYTIASKIYVLSKAMINALTVVAIPRISYYLGQGNQDNYNRVAKKLFSYLFMLIMPASVGLFAFSRNVILLVGGTDYISGEMALSILCIALPIAEFAGYFCNAIMIPNKMEKHFMIITIISAFINIGLNILLIPMLGIIGAAITTLISEIIVLTFGYIKTKKCVEIKINKKNFLSTVIGSVGVLIVSLACKGLTVHPYFQLIVGIISSCTIYFLIHIFARNELILDILSSIIIRKKNN